MTTIRFQLYHRSELLMVRAHLHDDALQEDGGGAAHVERECQIWVGKKLWKEWWEPLSPETVLAAHDACDETLRVAAALTHRPWSGQCVLRWPTWAKEMPLHRPHSPNSALTYAAAWWDAYQQRRFESDHPTGRSDAKAYREEAPAPWR